MKYLYHYTSVDTLELILRNRTIRFNPLYKMDDPQEKFSAHGVAQGRHYFISSWTSEAKELPAMWKGYCRPSAVEGVRIKLPINPFSTSENNLIDPVPGETQKILAVSRRIEKTVRCYYPEFNNIPETGLEWLDQYVAYKNRLMNEYPEVARPLIEASNQVQREKTICMQKSVDHLLEKVVYTDDPEKLYPHMYSTYAGQRIGDFSQFGRYKSTDWAWQKEWRYILSFHRMRSFRLHNDGSMTWYSLPFEHYDLKLDMEKLMQISVTTSPVISNDAKEKLVSILDSFLPGTPILKSELSYLQP